MTGEHVWLSLAGPKLEAGARMSAKKKRGGHCPILAVLAQLVLWLPGIVTAGLVGQSSSVTHDLDIVYLYIHPLNKLFFFTCNICFTARAFCLLHLSVT